MDTLGKGLLSLLKSRRLSSKTLTLRYIIRATPKCITFFTLSITGQEWILLLRQSTQLAPGA
jgi:hypothetical protein